MVFYHYNNLLLNNIFRCQTPQNLEFPFKEIFNEYEP